MSNVYETPKSNLEDNSENTSGLGKGHPIPEGVQGWSWGAFFLTWIWAIFNKTWIGLIAIIPYIGFIMAIVLGIKGREWAWQNKSWDSIEHFNDVQKKWSFWAVIFVVTAMALAIVAGVLS
jgi:hypothetical protein